MLEMLSYGFMQRALLAGLIIGLICPSIGIYLVLRRMSMIGDSLSHVALSGVAVGMLTGTSPIGMALVFTVGAALLVDVLRKHFRAYEELAIAIILSTGIALAVVIISIARSFNAQLYSYLFGSIATVTRLDLWVVIGLSVVVMSAIAYYYKDLFYITMDETSARLAGVPVKWLNLLFVILVSSTITLSMRIVGILLVSSLIVLPVATGLQIAKSFKQAFAVSIASAELSVFVGIFFAYHYELASGGTIVLFAVVQLLVVLVAKYLYNRIKRGENEKERSV